MNPQLPNFPLPVNLWEEVIDHCVPPPLGFFPNRRRLRHSVVESAVTLLACALTCREWLARSLFNLYSVCVILEDSKSVDRLVEIITMRPHLPPFVRILWVSPEEFLSPGTHPGLPSEQYIPFARTELIHKLTNLHTIAYLGRFRWPYPAGCNLHIARYRSLKTLYLDTRFRSPIELFRLVWTLEELEDLHLHRARFDSYPQNSLDPAYERLRSLAIQRPRCKSLESLMIDWDWSGIPAIPYECTFGTSLLRLGLSYDCRTLSKLFQEPWISNYISNLPSMVEFTLAIRNMWIRNAIETPSLFGIQTLVPWLCDTLVPQSCKSLRRIHLWLQIPLQSESNPLDDLFTPDHHLDDVCNRLPALRELIIQFDYVIHHTANGLRPLKPPDTRNVNEALLAAMPRLKIKLFVIVNGQFLNDIAEL